MKIGWSIRLVHCIQTIQKNEIENTANDTHNNYSNN